ncbi:ankyrin repeat domain-containing protein 50 [Parachaetomium inaequale]|uniref:Ankyrin repeat domain-containing protein 50 n=1 Tax=Parachaetomium inaequale TaxID=2588326 RepID=A0AAN6SSX7_9PEZI|nr:ankyrin repeat domain-containing protein 50 [Parachaetomium inaequale]
MADQFEVHEKGFTVLYEAPAPTVDIVFVHGFTGHPKDTWMFKSKARTGHRAKKDGRDGEPSSASRRSKLLRLFGRSPSAPVSTASSPQSSPTPNVKDRAGTQAQQHKDVYWPADLASQTVPNSRILTYGYDTKIRHWVAGPVSKKTVYDHAWDLLCSFEALRRHPNEKRRPILFVAHSLGGIVVKEALRRSRGCKSTKAHLYNIFEATDGILFFGTPHGGADPRSSLHHILSVSAQVLGAQVNQQIVNTLMPGAERLTELRDEFSVMCQEKSFLVYSFQEEYGVTALFGKKVVEDRSSCLNNSILETKQFISSNHMDMCRFSGFQDQEYAKVAAALTHILGTARGRADAISHGPSPRRTQSQDTRHATDDGCSDQQLYFTKIDERLTSLTPAQAGTCRWFFSKPEYISWRDPTKQPDHGGFLWIRGHPGTGKSTLMKLLFEKAKHSARGDSSQITLSFFFLARGTLEEKSTPGLYRSLLHQLFEKAADLQDSLEWMTSDGARGIQVNGWHEVALKQTFSEAIQKLGKRSLKIFVDALDECDDNQAKDMVSFFEELCELAQKKQVQLHICFSSRHYPHIEIKKGLKVILEDEIGHKEDVEHYIKAKLRLGTSRAAQSLQSELLERSQLIFLWVVLVIEILNHDYLGKPIDKMLKRLREIPKQLGELFEMILQRDPVNPELLQLCLKWILFAARPMKPQELYFAIQFGLDQEEGFFGSWDQDDVDLQTMETSVREWSKGLAEVTRNETSEVQFIHESVRDFLLGRYRSQWSEASGNLVGHGHEALRDYCLAQVNAAVSQNVHEPSVSIKTDAQASQYRATIRLKIPFLEYSVNNILRHANSAQEHRLDQGAFLSQFPLRSWKMLDRRFKSGPEQKYGEAVSLLYLLAEKNLADLIKVYPWKESCFHVGYVLHEVPLYGPPIFAALAHKSTEAAQALLEAEVRGQPFEPLFRDRWQQYKGRETDFTKFGISFSFLKWKGVLSHLAEQGDGFTLAVLLSSAFIDVDVNFRDLLDRTPLSHAAERGHLGVAKLLLGKGAKVDFSDCHLGMSPLAHASHSGYEALVTLLLEHGADVNSRGWLSGRSPLSYASQRGHLGIVKLLLERGAEVDPKSEDGSTPLSCAAEEGHEAVMAFLLENGADVEWKDSLTGRSLLSYACQSGSLGIAKLLLESGVEVDSKSACGRTPLSYAACDGDEASVALLLEHGADIEWKDDDGQTPLSISAMQGHEATVEQLLRKGAEVDSKDRVGCTPLSYAAGNGDEAMVKLLSQNGARVNSKDKGKRPELFRRR